MGGFLFHQIHWGLIIFVKLNQVNEVNGCCLLQFSMEVLLMDPFAEIDLATSGR